MSTRGWDAESLQRYSRSRGSHPEELKEAVYITTRVLWHRAAKLSGYLVSIVVSRSAIWPLPGAMA